MAIAGAGRVVTKPACASRGCPPPLGTVFGGRGVLAPKRRTRALSALPASSREKAERTNSLGGEGNADSESRDLRQESHRQTSGSASSPPAASSTDLVHAGERHGRPSVGDALTTPIVQTSTYWFKDTEELIAYQEGNHKSYEYGRYGNPTVRVCEEKLMALEGAEECLLSSSGMTTATNLFLSGLVPTHGHIVVTTDCYRRTRQFIQTFLQARMGAHITVIEPSDLDALQSALDCDDKPTPCIFFSESPTNPYLRCIDIPKVSAMCREKGCLVCIDATFATPCNQRPLHQGADLVIHSGTKYLAGHNDVLCGAIAGPKHLVSQVRDMQNVLGGVMDPHGAYLLLRGMKTLDLRVARHNANAMALATHLEDHPRVAKVHYPGLPSHRDHLVARDLMPSGYGGVVSFEVDGDLWETARVVDGCNLPYIAPSLGGVESLIEQPTVISYWDQPKEVREQIGIKDNLIRYSCGIENFEDIWEDLKAALDAVK